MLELTLLGHASVLIRGGGTLICDPIFADEISGGGNLIDPPRRIDVERIGEVDAILLTHHHSDHYDPASIDRLNSVQRKPIFAPAGSPIVAELRRRGYHVEELGSGSKVQIAGIEVTATPSDVRFPEIGFYFKRRGATVLNLADTIIHGVIDELRALAPCPSLLLAPFQAGGYMSLLPLRVGGAPAGLIDAIRQWSSGYVEELADDLERLAPRCVVPFADGITYRDSSINSWHFPLPDEVFAESLRNRQIAMSSATPGSCYRISTAGVELVDDSAGIVELMGPRADRRFEPNRKIDPTPLPCRPRATTLIAATPSNPEALLGRLTDHAALAIARQSTNNKAILEQHCGRWELELCDVLDSTLRRLRIDFSGERVVVRPRAPDEADHPYGIRTHWCDLQCVLEGQIPFEFIELSGAFRYVSPSVVDSLECIRDRVMTPLRALLAPSTISLGS